MEHIFRSLIKSNMNPFISSSPFSSSTMASRGALLFLKANCFGNTKNTFGNTKNTFGKQKTHVGANKVRNFATRSALQPPDVSRLAQTARISLTPNEVEEFGPKMQQVIEWFGQLQAVDLESIEPAIRADYEGDNLRDDVPELYQNREAMIAAIPSYQEPYIRVPKILNKE